MLVQTEDRTISRLYDNSVDSAQAHSNVNEVYLWSTSLASPQVARRTPPVPVPPLGAATRPQTAPIEN